MTPSIGKVYLIGGGPGDPGLITLRARQCLVRADVILYDYLVNPRILDLVPARIERVCLGRHGRDRVLPQEEINQLLVRHARAGRTVARLKGGDPIVFAHAAEEICALEQAGVPYEIVPGITAALAVGSYAGIPLTQGDAASAVALVTGQERRDKPASLDYQALAAFPGTLVFYMGVTTAEHWTAQLIAAGKPAHTPAAIVWRCSLPDQRTIACTLGSVAREIATRRLRPPALVVVGPVAAQSTAHNWFVERPLFGTRILVTRSAQQAPELAFLLGDLGADVLVQPAIEIAPPDDWAPVDAALARLADFDWLVFSSANGVSFLLSRLLQHRDLRALGSIKLAAIGSGSAEELARFQLKADVVPEEYRAESLAAALADEAALGKRFLLARASRGREVLAAELKSQGGHVEEIVVYASRDVPAADEQVVEQLRAGHIDWITVTSSAIARSLARMFGADLGRARLASISPVTSATVRELGYEVAVEARTYTIAGLVEAISAAAKP
jgi:uroporphyrinogen III methyltransferase/synthase